MTRYICCRRIHFASVSISWRLDFGILRRVYELSTLPEHLSSFMTCHQVCNKRDTTGTTCGTVANSPKFLYFFASTDCNNVISSLIHVVLEISNIGSVGLIIHPVPIGELSLPCKFYA